MFAMTATPTLPRYHGCADASSLALPYCNASLPWAERVADIVPRLNVTEKIGLLSPHDPPNYCRCVAQPVPRIGLPGWQWLTEVNSDVINCLHGRCGTSFVGPAGIAASFNRSSWWAKGDVLSTEIRVHNNVADPGTPVTENKVALSAYGPNVNLVKDPRYGRNSELPGEDPYLSGEYAAAYVQGLQQPQPGGELKILAMLKHYTAYSKEVDRFTWTAPVSAFDLWDSYLPAFEKGFVAGGASGAMCSYFAANGTPSCGSDYLLNRVVRSTWARPEAIFMSDCSAVANFLKMGFAANKTDASAKALNAGLDVYGGWGDHLWGEGDLEEAIRLGMSDEATLDAAVTRTLLAKMRVGVFDPVTSEPWAPWTTLDESALNSSHAQRVAYEAALQSIVLLKNSGGALPLGRGGKLAVVGPMAVKTAGLRSDYAHWSSPTLPPSIAEALAAANRGGATRVAAGVGVDSTNASGVAAALDAVRWADATVLVLGITRDQEHEGTDRADTKLPGLQPSFALQVLGAAAGRPVVVVLCNGGILSIDDLVAPAPAIVEAFNPLDHGTRAVAALLFGDENRWGQLPVTIYPANYTAELDAAGAGIANYEMAKAPGRSYRYYTGVPLFPFGHGLSYSSFALACAREGTTGLAFECTVTNTGDRGGDRAVLAFHRPGDAVRRAAGARHPVPLRRLVGFERLSVAKEGVGRAAFAFDADDLALTAEDGSRRVYEGGHELVFALGDGQEVVVGVRLPIGE